MVWWQWIITIASVLGAITAIVVFIKTGAKKLLKWLGNGYVGQENTVLTKKIEATYAELDHKITSVAEVTQLFFLENKVNHMLKVKVIEPYCYRSFDQLVSICKNHSNSMISDELWLKVDVIKEKYRKQLEG